MEVTLSVLVTALSYLIGSIPFGLILVKVWTGKDLRQIASGRTGGTNAGRAAGMWIGVLTALLDGIKGIAAVTLSRALLPGHVWLDILAPLAAILGHNYSIFMIERDASGRVHLRGGAGGAPCVGGSIGLWAPSLFIILPLAALILYFVGYASVTTMSVALISTLLFAYRAWIGASPWEYALYGVLAELLLIWALRPNIRRLLQGKERLVGLRARRKQRDE
ncbi:MAG: glycerol-3-phosphate acyltransferase [Anaerolineales bacterium]|nr:glycerol-3-phosphate acyltransferase [Anaerolineales bacterium]